jgi:hypothetical protein
MSPRPSRVIATHEMDKPFGKLRQRLAPGTKDQSPDAGSAVDGRLHPRTQSDLTLDYETIGKRQSERRRVTIGVR